MPNKLELLLRKAGRELRDHQVCRFFKVPEEMAATPVDFFGYTSSGRAILIEAKMVNRTSLPIGQSPGLLPHQWAELEDASKANALSLICWARSNVSACLTFEMARELSAGRRSIPWSKIEERFLRSMSGPTAHLALLEPWLCAMDKV